MNISTITRNNIKIDRIYTPVTYQNMIREATLLIDMQLIEHMHILKI